MHLRTRSITASKCISELLNLSLQMSVQTYSITASKWITELLDLGLQMHLRTRIITASKCISELLNLGLQIRLQPCSITASKCISELLDLGLQCISKLAQSRPPSGSLSSTRSRPPSASSNSLDRGLQVHLPVYMITASKCISNVSQSASPGAPAITLQYRLQPDWPYVYISRDLDT